MRPVSGGGRDGRAGSALHLHSWEHSPIQEPALLGAVKKLRSVRGGNWKPSFQEALLCSQPPPLLLILDRRAASAPPTHAAWERERVHGDGAYLAVPRSLGMGDVRTPSSLEPA